MVNPLELLKARVEKANYLLKQKKIGATIYIRKDAFFLRAYLPSKVNPNWNKLNQQWIPIGLKAETKNISKARDLAYKLGAEKASQLFNWELWLEKEEYQPPTKRKKSFLMKDLLPDFEKNYWEDPKKDKENKSHQAGYQHIKNYLTKLNPNRILNLKNVKELAETYPQKSKSRMEIAKQFLRLAKFAEISDLKEFSKWSIPTQQAYKPKKRKKLDDKEYFEFIKSIRQDPQWGWAIAAMFVFGCRTSEVWSLQPYEKKGRILGKMITIDKATEPDEWRTAFALEQTWARELNILDVQKEIVIEELEDYDAATCKSVNDRFRKWLSRQCKAQDIKFMPYDLRHAYGRRTARKNISTVNAGKWMGHSPEMHGSTYQEEYGESDILEVVDNLGL